MNEQDPPDEKRGPPGALFKSIDKSTGRDLTASEPAEQKPLLIEVAPGTPVRPELIRPGVIVVIKGELPEFNGSGVAALARADRGYAGLRRPLARAKRLAAQGLSVVLIRCANGYAWRGAIGHIVPVTFCGHSDRWWRRARPRRTTTAEKPAKRKALAGPRLVWSRPPRGGGGAA